MDEAIIKSPQLVNYGLFSVGKLGHLGWAITMKAYWSNAGLDSKEISAVIYSWHKWVRTQPSSLLPQLPLSPAASETSSHHPHILSAVSHRSAHTPPPSLHFLPTHINHIRSPAVIHFHSPGMFWTCMNRLFSLHDYVMLLYFKRIFKWFNSKLNL